MPDVIGPLERRERRTRETFEHHLICVLQCDDRPKKINVLGLLGYEGDLDSSTGHGNSRPPTRYSVEWQWQNCYVTSLRTTGVCPYRPWGEPDAALEFGRVFN